MATSCLPGNRRSWS